MNGSHVTANAKFRRAENASHAILVCAPPAITCFNFKGLLESILPSSFAIHPEIAPAAMLDIHRTSNPRVTKIYTSHSILPPYIDPLNVSSKKQPFCTFNAQPFTHTLHLALPAELWDLISSALLAKPALAAPQYARVHLKLSDILERDFLDTYIKHGAITMLSEGRPLLDNRFQLVNGQLRLELDRPTYERCGLQGVPVEDGGKKHSKARWVVTYDLTSPSMRHGKKGFERLVWASRNVLNASLTWLFWNANPSSREALAEGREELSKHAPFLRTFAPKVRRMDGVRAPKLTVRDLHETYFEDEALGLLEWLHMLQLGSPRVEARDDVDPHVSRYEVPECGHGVEIKDFVNVTWTGFMAPEFAREVFLLVREHGFKRKKDGDAVAGGDAEVDMGDEKTWYAMSAQAFGGQKSWTLMQFARRDTLAWATES